MPLIETLGAATDLDEIRKYAVLPENIDATIESLDYRGRRPQVVEHTERIEAFARPGRPCKGAEVHD